MEFLAFDPGETTGWARFVDSAPVAVGTVGLDELYPWLESDGKAELYVIEDYIIRPMGNYQHQWNKGNPLRVIGALTHKAFLLGIEVVLQQPSIKDMARRHLGMPKTSSTFRHSYDAVLHGHYYNLKKDARS